MSFVHKIMAFRLNIDQEYQGWILAFATLTAFWVYCLPCYCAGLSIGAARRKAAWLQQRLPYYLFAATIFNGGLMFMICTWLPDWTPADYVKTMARFAIFGAKNAVKFMTAIAFIVIFIFVVAFKDRFMKLAGVDHKTVFRFKLRDMFGGGSTRAIAVDIWKVEELPAQSVLAPNNVFVEVFLGYNEPMKTRVHNNAGTNCTLKETVQLNFDDNEDEEPLYLFVKNQKMVGTGELGRLELKAEDIVTIEKETAGGKSWDDGRFVKKDLVPRGKIWFRVTPVEDEDAKMQVC